MLWLCSKWDDLNQYFANVDYMQLLKQTAIFYIIFMAGYLVLCALVAIYQHKKCRERRDQYLRYLHRLNKSYLAEEKARGGRIEFLRDCTGRNAGKTGGMHGSIIKNKRTYLSVYR